MIREIGRERENKNRTLFEQNQQTLFNQQPVHVTLVHISSWDQLKTTKNRSGPLTNFGGCSQPCDAEVVRRKDNKKTKKETGWKTSDYAVGASAFRNIGRRGRNGVSKGKYLRWESMINYSDGHERRLILFIFSSIPLVFKRLHEDVLVWN